jgi:ElaB/YqjD/DUF883 family membrane-anchored ribosome-binding protein
MERFGTDPKEIAEKAHEIQGKMKGMLKNVSSEVHDRVEKAKDYARELREKDPGEIVSDVGGFVKEHPIATIASCLFVGYWAGRLLGGRS